MLDIIFSQPVGEPIEIGMCITMPESEEVLKISKEGFFAKMNGEWKRVEDINNLYDRFCEYMSRFKIS